MQTMLGGGKIYFLTLAVSLTVYVTLSSTPPKKHPNPSLAAIIPPDATVVEQNAMRYKFTLETELYLIHIKIDKAPKQQLLEVVKEIYVCP